MSNFTVAEHRTEFGAGRVIRVVVNNPRRSRDGKTGTVYDTVRASPFSDSGFVVWVHWDDDHYPSNEDLTSLALASEES